MKSDSSFWKDVRQKRNLHFIWWLAWIPAAVSFLVVYKLIFGSHPGNWIFAFLLAWYISWLFTSFRLASIRCSRCNEKAISHALFFMKHAKCKNCGYSYSDFLLENRHTGHS